MRHGLLKKEKEREKDGMPKKHDPKKNWTRESPRKRKKEERYTII